MATCLIAHFPSLEDPRIERNKRHQLPDIIVLTAAAVASGADGWEAIGQCGRGKPAWLRRFVPLANGCLPTIASSVR